MPPLRNIGIMAHIDAGKTTCAERILYCTGRIHKKGEVHHGDTTLDFDPLEIKHKITINAAATSVIWNGHRVQIVDTPGHVDFGIEVERSLRVLDGAIFVLDGGEGVECQSETVFRQAERHGVASLVFVNKIDKPGADFDMCLRSLRERLGVLPCAAIVPSSEAGELLDVIARKRLRFDAHGRASSESFTNMDVEKHRRALVEACADHDDEVFAAYCSGAEVSSEALKRALREGTRKRALVVVTCGSALKNVGISTLLDAVVDYLPAPAGKDDEPLAALAFKTVVDRSGHLTYVRVYSGVLRTGALVRVSSGTKERVGRIHQPHADQLEDVEAAHAGEIVAVTGLRNVKTGQTLCDPNSEIVLPPIEIPDPVVEIAIEPKTSDDRDRLGGALAKLTTEDPSLHVRVDGESGQTRLLGMGQLHLQIAVERLAAQRVFVSEGRPLVAYRETIARTVSAEHRLIKQGGGNGQYAVVTLEVSPASRGSGVSFVDRTTGGVVPREYVPGVEKGVRGAAARGVFTGHPLVDVSVALLDGQAHAKDSSAQAFEIAASLAFQKCCRESGLVLLEPFVRLEVTVPEEHVGDVIGDLGARRGIVQNVTPRNRATQITARAPLASTFDYVASLRGFTHGRGSSTMMPDGYEVAPASSIADATR